MLSLTVVRLHEEHERHPLVQGASRGHLCNSTALLFVGAVPADTDWLDLARPVIEKRIHK